MKTTALSKALTVNQVNLNKLLVIIPCYNEALNIETTVNKLLKVDNFDFIIVNDGSKDNITTICDKKNWKCLNITNHKGLSNAIRVGINYAIQLKYEYVVQFDGNGKYNPRDIISMVGWAQKGYDIILSSKYYKKQNLNKDYKICEKIINSLFIFKSKQKVTDIFCGFRLFNWWSMNTYSENKRLEVEPSSICFLIKKEKMKVKELPTNYTSSKKRKSRKKMFFIKEIFRLIFLFTMKG